MRSALVSLSLAIAVTAAAPAFAQDSGDIVVTGELSKSDAKKLRKLEKERAEQQIELLEDEESLIDANKDLKDAQDDLKDAEDKVQDRADEVEKERKKLAEIEQEIVAITGMPLQPLSTED